MRPIGPLPPTDTQLLDYLEQLFQHCPHAELSYTRPDEAEWSEHPPGWTLSVSGCETTTVTEPTLRECLALFMNTLPGVTSATPSTVSRRATLLQEFSGTLCNWKAGEEVRVVSIQANLCTIERLEWIGPPSSLLNNQCTGVPLTYLKFLDTDPATPSTESPPACRLCGTFMYLAPANAIPPAIIADGAERLQGAHVGHAPLVTVWKCPACGHSFQP